MTEDRLTRDERSPTNATVAICARRRCRWADPIEVGSAMSVLACAVRVRR